MIQPIAGLTPSEVAERTVMVVWPSNAAWALGRWLGRLYALRWGWYVFTLGNLAALLSIPLALALYFLKVLPGMGIRYRLTNRRVVVERGLRGKEERAVALDAFDRIDAEVLDGQAWYAAADLVFRQGETEVLRLAGVSRPDCFRQACWKARQAVLAVRRVRSRAAANA